VACRTENRIGSKFCDNCGTPLSSSCPACGEPNRSDARFCAGCGSPLDADMTAPASMPAQTPGQSAESTAERRLVSVLFIDLVGFTTLAEDRDPEAVRDLLSRYFDTATGIVSMHGGAVEKFIGDAVMAVWGAPVAHEDDAERAVRAALEIVDAVPALDAGLAARAGVLTGEAAVTLGATNQGMVAGDLVNTAARLQGAAEPGAVLVGEATRLASERSIVFEPLGDHSLKGKSAPVPAWRAMRVVANRGGQGRTDALEPPFVGRDEELRQLKELLHAAGRERRPRLISITGPGGIGKSRLVWELEKYVDGVAEDVWWHRGRSPSYGEGITFWALGEMVRRRAGLVEDDDEGTTRRRIAVTVDEFVADADRRPEIVAALLALLGVEPAPGSGRDVLFPAWRTLFEQVAERGTTVLVFEDLQWADTGLLDFIDHLLDWSRSLPIVIVTLARPELFDRRPDWGAGRRSFVGMTLDPLAPDQMRRLLDGLVPGLPPDVVSAIVDRADGVPLYAVETVRALLAQGRLERAGEEYRPVGDLSKLAIPESLRSLIASRLDALPASDRALLQAASVLGQVFGAEALGAITGGSVDEVHEVLRSLARRELLQLETDPASPERGQFKFMQALIREVAYGTMGRRDRRALHLAVARHYEAVGDDELAGALASHYLAALEASDEGPEAAALAAQARLALRGAAERAAALGAHLQAVAHFQRALEVTTDARERAVLLLAAARSAGMAATGTGPSLAAEGAAEYRAAGDVVGATRALGLQGELLVDASQLEDAATVLEEALASIADDTPDVEAELAAYLSRAYMRQYRPTEAIAMADRALAIGERLNLDPVVSEALINKGSAIGMLGRRREAEYLIDGAVRLAAGGPASREMRARHNLAVHLLESEPARAVEQLRATLDLARRVGDLGHYAWVLGTIVFQSLSRAADLDEVVAMAREALETLPIKGDRGRLRASVAAIEAARGQRLDEIPAEMDAILGDATGPEAEFYRDLPKAQVLLARGEYAAAYRLGLRVADLPTQGVEFGVLIAQRAAIALRDPDLAREARDRVDALPGTGPVFAAFRAHATAAVAALEGRAADARAAFQVSRDTHRALENWFDFALGAVDAVSLLPNEPELVAWAAEARPILERVGAVGEIARLDADAAAGVPPDTDVRDSAAVGDRTGAG
jgi:class 3 adenylate cyclase/tetratricopeptide (TPR) repeat protein